MKDKTAIITGSTSGIGLGIAKILASKGCNIVLNGFGDAKEIESIRSDLEKDYNISSIYLNADMSKPEEIHDMAKKTLEKFGYLDIIVNNAGIQYVSAVEDFPVEKWDSILAINLSAGFHLIQASLPYMKKQNWGRVVNIASAHGLVASVNKSAYVAAKHGLVGLTKVVALETAEFNITCNAICPGWVLTPLVQKQIDDRAIAENITIQEAKINLLSEKQPSLEFVKPEDIGELVAFLCSESASQIRGVALPIDGGWTSR